MAKLISVPGSYQNDADPQLVTEGPLPVCLGLYENWQQGADIGARYDSLVVLSDENIPVCAASV